ncbi:MAG: hypothetical protein RBG13Loki_0275 [Promethearchaeota archaeon CR_4]|nr:MAG: hypothetical protein RBG13Loki_0275 [Candidatus Lokiarchaeota archaeon CR_4]
MQVYSIEPAIDGIKPELKGKLVNTLVHTIGKTLQNILEYTSWKISIKIVENTPPSSGVLVRVYILNKEEQGRILTEFNLPEEIVEVILRGIIENMSPVYLKPGNFVLDW